MEGKLVRLRAYEREDLDNVMSWVNDPEVTRTMASFPYSYVTGTGGGVAGESGNERG